MTEVFIFADHDLDVIRLADWVVELGPGGGEQGGQIVFSGDAELLKAGNETATQQALCGDPNVIIYKG